MCPEVPVIRISSVGGGIVRGIWCVWPKFETVNEDRPNVANTTMSNNELDVFDGI